MDGRVAEEIIFGYDKVSSGASGDIQYATKLARDMVTRWGMSDKLGPLQYSEGEEEVFLGYSRSQNMHMSNETARAIDTEIRDIVIDVAGQRIPALATIGERLRSEEHTSELQSLMRISYAVFCLKKKIINTIHAP